MQSTLTPTSNRPRRRIGRLLLAAGLAVCALPASASAATVVIEPDGTLRYSGDSLGAAVTIRELADGFEVTDSVRLDLVPNGFATCTRLGTRTALCGNRGTVIRRVAANLNGGADTVGPINTQLPVEVIGGSGNDTYEAGNPSFLTNVRFGGGSGVDTVNYSGSGGSGAGGVRISNDDVANDGRIGLDTDNVGRDVENLTGSRFADEITANGPLDFRVTGVFAFTSVQGGQGDDFVRVGAHGNQGVEILNGPVADGADKIIGGPAISFVDYSERTRPVNATLNFGGADDGEAGEGDEILGGNEVLLGGLARDVLRAPAGSRARHSISGNGGDDQIDGADGNDSLTGGRGNDTIIAFRGDDNISAQDGEKDTLTCGFDTDTAEVDSFDSVGFCENVTLGVLRLTPKALRAKRPARPPE